ncbi:YitT family protein [Clostridiales bacterium FE2011]|nr:YitT family protein [Clostridiales bacterium FE2011]QTE74614.1 YitT family protein [Clostridiales bacterium FE2010]
MVKSLRSAISKRPAAAERFFSYAQIILGALIGGAAYPLFMTPNKIAPGGITGIATILNHLFQWPVGTVTLILNVPLFLISYKAMGRIFAFRSLVATLFFTLFIDVLPLQPMTTDPLLGALYGGVMLGAGLGLIMRGGATTGGSDMVARMVNKRFQFISTGSFLFAIDFAVVVSAGFLIGATEALYSLICIFLSARIMDTIIIGFSSNKACFIISSRWQEISDRIMRDMDRGVTQLTARGAYTGAERPTLLCVIGRSEIMALKRILREEDEKAFVIIVEAHEAIGDGFTHLTD